MGVLAAIQGSRMYLDANIIWQIMLESLIKDGKI